jgi:membrane fusion protein (multidrug efflux system)
MSRHPLLRFVLILPFIASVAACGGDARGEAGNARQRNASGGGPGGGGGGGGPGGGGFGGGFGGPRGGPGSKPSPVEIVTVSRGTLARTTTVSGILEPLRTVGVNAQMSGALLSVNVEEGNYVRAGQTLAQIDAREIEAQLKSATAALDLAESTAKRSDELWKQRIITAQEYERDRANLASSQATLDGLRTRIGYATVKAPISGVVTEKRLETGDIVSPNTRLFSVADMSMLVSRVMVSELDVPLLKAGDVVDVTVDALGGSRVPGRIRRVFPAADSATRLVPVEVALSGSAISSLRPGNTIRSVFRLGSRNDAMLIPTRAVMGPVGARAVVVVRQGKSERRLIRVGPDIDGTTEVLEGLAVGDTVIVAGQALLRDGSPVRVVPPIGEQAAPTVNPEENPAAAAKPESRRPRRSS